MPRRLLVDSRSPDTISDIPYLDDTKVNNLLFADDLAIFSLSKEDLLNLSKTKVMVFNKQGTTIKKFNFFFKDKKSKQ